MKLPQLVYDCDRCGACCRYLIVEAEHLDALREPRIQTEARLLDGHGRMPLEDAAWGLNRCAPKGGSPCVFLGDDNTCGIYATRPNVCVNVQAGSYQCQTSRESAGLPRLDGRPSTHTMPDRLYLLACGDTNAGGPE